MVRYVLPLSLTLTFAAACDAPPVDSSPVSPPVAASPADANEPAASEEVAKPASPTRANATAAPAATASASNFLVWEQLEPAPDKPPRHRTTWVRVDDAGAHVEGSVDQLLLAHDEFVFIWDIVVTKVRAQGCEWTPEVGEGHRYEQFDDWAGRLLRAGRYVQPVEVHEPLPRDYHSIEDYQRTPMLTGNVGPYVFTKEIVYEMECEAANGDTTAGEKIIDLRDGSTVELTKPLDAATYAAIEPQLIAALERKDPDTYFTRPRAHTDVTTVTARPHIEGDRVQIQHQLAVETASVASDDEWEEGTISVYLPLPVAGLSAEDQSVPEGIRAQLGRTDDTRPRGFTEVTSAAALTEVEQLFGSR